MPLKTAVDTTIRTQNPHANIRLLGCLLALAGCIRIWVAFFSKATWYNTDTYTYLEMAKGILAGKPVSSQPNGYPLLIVVLQWFCGPSFLPAALIVFNVIASGLIVLLCYRLGSALASERVGLLAAAMTAIWPNQINYMRQILSETSATFFLVLGVDLIRTQRHTRGAISLSIAAYIRSTLAPVVLLTFVWVCLSRRKTNDILLYVGGVAVIFLLNVALVKLRFIEPSSNAGSNLLMAIQSSSTEGIRFDADSFAPEQKMAPLKTYLSFAAASPGTFIKQRLSSLWELWGPWPERGDALRPRSVLSRLVIGLRCPLLILAVIELVRKRRSARHWLLAIPILVVTGVHTLFFSTPRFSYSAEPFVMVLCAMLLVPVGRWCIDRFRPDPPTLIPAA